MVDLDKTIIWEDADILVINKPAGVVVNRAESVKAGTVQDWVMRKFSIFNFQFSKNNDEVLFWRRGGVAHRLDKETSGCLLIAKNPPTLTSLLSQFAQRETKKEYLALVHGRMGVKEGTIRLPLARSRFVKEKWEIRYDGKMAETTWKVENFFKLSGMELTLVRLFPKTGRTHQIRVHLAHLGFPIFADEKYLTKNLVTADRQQLKRHFLHAVVIGFKDMSGRSVSVSADLTDDLKHFISQLEEVY